VPREQIFIDTAVSGTISAPDRPGFRALLEYVRSHEITTLYVYEISRIGRSFLEKLDAVRGLEEECGVIVWSLSPKEAWILSAAILPSHMPAWTSDARSPVSFAVLTCIASRLSNTPYHLSTACVDRL